MADWSPITIDRILSFYEDPFCIIGFDPAILALGVASVDIDCNVSKLFVRLDGTLENLERAVKRLYNLLDAFIRVYVDVWQLADKAGDVDAAARSLKAKLTRLNRPDRVGIERQMNINDKSKTIGSFLRFNYCDICPIIMVGGALKNTVSLGADITHQKFLAKNNTTYKANKEHCAASLVRWTQVFNVDIRHIPPKNRKDAGDALMQIFALIKHKKIF